jgi:hypothetical protein
MPAASLSHQQLSKKLWEREDNHGLVASQLQQLPISRDQVGGLGGDGGGKHEIVFRLGRHSLYGYREFGDEGAVSEKIDGRLYLGCGKTPEEIGITQRPLSLGNDVFRYHEIKGECSPSGDDPPCHARCVDQAGHQDVRIEDDGFHNGRKQRYGLSATVLA